MGIDLRGYKVIYGEFVLNAIALKAIEYDENSDFSIPIQKPKFIEVVAINTDGTIITISDEAWRFQFVPKLDS